MTSEKWEVRLSMCSCCPPGEQRERVQHGNAHSYWFHAPGGRWQPLGVKVTDAKEVILAFGDDKKMRGDVEEWLRGEPED